MKGNHFAVSTSKGSQENIISYFGRDGVVIPTDLIYQQAAESLIDVSTTIATIALSKKVPMWTSLSAELAQFRQGFLDPKVPIKRYQLDLLVEAILPYLQDRKNTIHTNASRFSQIETLLQILSGGDTSPMPAGTAEIGCHPYHILMKIEKIIITIDREGGMWKSKLSTALEVGVKKQWAPIICDHQLALSSIGGKLCMLGLVEAVGRPVVMLYPLFLITQEALKISSEIEVKKTVSVQSVMQIGKMIAMLLCIIQLSSILTMYTGLGYTCLALGCAAMFVSTNDELTKSAVPVLAPHMASIGVFMDQIYRLESVAINAFSNLNMPSPSSSSSSSASGGGGSRDMPTGSAVEELPSEDTTTPTSRGVVNTVNSPTTAVQFSSVGDESLRVANAVNVFDTPHSPHTSVMPVVSGACENDVSVARERARESEENERRRDDDDYVFAELDVYAVQTDILHPSRSDSAVEGLRQRRP